MSKADTLYETLKRKVLTGRPGQSFVSFRNIMSDYSVSQVTVSKATQRLLEEGLLKKHTGKEMEITAEVLRHRHTSPPVICLALPLWQSNWYDMIENNFHRLANPLGYELEVIRYNWESKVPATLPETRVDGLALITDAQMLSANDLKTISDFQLPFVLFDRNLSGMAVNCVSSDDEYAGARAAHCLIELGHQSLAVVISEPKSESVTDRIKGFRQFCELHSINAEIIDCGIVNGDFGVNKVY
ncbi:MAG: GntR family transcriptional regulator, partial [Clostridia bacterium]|nr:GntR family transcriptional regulator [Clostridia bacterium]